MCSISVVVLFVVELLKGTNFTIMGNFLPKYAKKLYMSSIRKEDRMKAHSNTLMPKHFVQIIYIFISLEHKEWKRIKLHHVAQACNVDSLPTGSSSAL